MDGFAEYIVLNNLNNGYIRLILLKNLRCLGKNKIWCIYIVVKHLKEENNGALSPHTTRNGCQSSLKFMGHFDMIKTKKF